MVAAGGGGNKSWVPVENLSLEKVTKQAIVHTLTQYQMETANRVVPWFLKHMPVSRSRRLSRHLLP